MITSTLPGAVLTLIRLALDEDIGGGDITCEFFVGPEAVSSARIVAREPGILAGGEVACASPFTKWTPGSRCSGNGRTVRAFAKGDTLLRVTGPTRGILTAERTALNFLQRLCGVATHDATLRRRRASRIR